MEVSPDQLRYKCACGSVHKTVGSVKVHRSKSRKPECKAASWTIITPEGAAAPTPASPPEPDPVPEPVSPFLTDPFGEEPLQPAGGGWDGFQPYVPGEGEDMFGVGQRGPADARRAAAAWAGGKVGAGDGPSLIRQVGMGGPRLIPPTQVDGQPPGPTEIRDGFTFSVGLWALCDWIRNTQGWSLSYSELIEEVFLAYWREKGIELAVEVKPVIRFNGQEAGYAAR